MASSHFKIDPSISEINNNCIPPGITNMVTIKTSNYIRESCRTESHSVGLQTT